MFIYILFNLITLIGSWQPIFIIWNCLVIIDKMLKSSIYMPNLFEKYSQKGKASYAILTGSSDGIGEEYAY